MESTSTTPAASALHQKNANVTFEQDLSVTVANTATLHMRVIAHLVMVYKLQPDYATRAAVYYSRINPYQLATMPDDLTREMLKLSDER